MSEEVLHADNTCGNHDKEKDDTCVLRINREDLPNTEAASDTPKIFRYGTYIFQRVSELRTFQLGVNWEAVQRTSPARIETQIIHTCGESHQPNQLDDHGIRTNADIWGNSRPWECGHVETKLGVCV